MARQRNQKYWEQLLELSAELCGAYLSSGQAITDASQFYRAIDQIASLENEVKRKKEEHNTAWPEGARAKQEVAARRGAVAWRRHQARRRDIQWARLVTLESKGIVTVLAGELTHSELEH